QVKRLTGFTHSNSDPSGATYNVTQSKIAVGAGGFGGRGVKNATQTNLDYLPEHATDFVFASLAEQRGFVGAAILLCLYLLVVWRGLRIITVARDLFSSIVAGGIVVALLFQIFVNIGMTVGIAPITGIPLRFVSIGGSPEDGEATVSVVGDAATDEDERMLKLAHRARVPTIAVAAGREAPPHIPFVLATDVVRVEPGHGFPVEMIARMLARKLGENA